MAVIALGGMVVAHSLRIGGYDLDDAIVRHVQQEHKLLIGQEQAEQVKIEIGSALDGVPVADSADVAGRDLVTGMLRRATVAVAEVRRALERPLAQIVDALRDLLERTPAELSSDVATRGVTLVGGGVLLHGFDDLVRRETGLPAVRDPEPLTTVARGAGAALEEFAALRPRSRRRRSRRG